MTGGCAATEKQGRDAIAVSFEPQAWLASRIAGDDFDIVTLLPPGSDPEVYQPSVSTMKNIADATVYFTLHTPGFEQNLVENISDNFPDLKIVDSASEVAKIHDSHGNINSSDANADNFDPHILASVRNCIAIARTMIKSLSSIYPERASDFKKSGEQLISQLQELDDSISALDLKGKSIVIRHPSLSYFARDYGVAQLPLSDVGKEASALQMIQRINDSASSHPSVMVVEMEHASSSDHDSASRLGVDTIRVALNTSSWLNDLMRLAHEIDRN